MALKRAIGPVSHNGLRDVLENIPKHIFGFVHALVGIDDFATCVATNRMSLDIDPFVARAQRDHVLRAPVADAALLKAIHTVLESQEVVVAVKLCQPLLWVGHPVTHGQLLDNLTLETQFRDVLHEPFNSLDLVLVLDVFLKQFL